jgi:type II secretory pathway component PulF
VDQAVRLIEPLVLVMMAAGIGLLAYALLTAIMSMAQSLG